MSKVEIYEDECEHTIFIIDGIEDHVSDVLCSKCGKILLSSTYVAIIKRLKNRGLLPFDYTFTCCYCY